MGQRSSRPGHTGARRRQSATDRSGPPVADDVAARIHQQHEEQQEFHVRQLAAIDLAGQQPRGQVVARPGALLGHDLRAVLEHLHHRLAAGRAKATPNDDGTWTYDEDTVLDVRALLQAHQDGHGRFLSLGHGRFVALTEKIKALGEAHARVRLDPDTAPI